MSRTEVIIFIDTTPVIELELANASLAEVAKIVEEEVSALRVHNIHVEIVWEMN